jgi:hypothetical protein
MEKLTCADVRPIERSGEQHIEIKEGKGWNQEIRLVDVPELHRFDPLPFQQKDSGQNYAQQQNDCQCSEILWHRNSPRPRGMARLTNADHVDPEDFIACNGEAEHQKRHPHAQQPRGADPRVSNGMVSI